MTALALLVCLWLCSIGVLEGLAGVEFYVAFMGLDSNANRQDRYRQPKIFVTNPSPEEVAQVSISYLGVTGVSTKLLVLGGGASDTVFLHDRLVLSGAAKHRACAVVTSSTAVLVQAQLTHDDTDQQQSLVGYQALPVTSMTGDYVVATHCVTNTCTFLVTSPQDDTVVVVHLRTDGTGSALYNGTQYGDGQQFEERLDRGQSLQVTCNTCDLTGTKVSASRKVTVVGGGDYTQYDVTRSFQDAVADVMLPVQALGQQYVLGSNYVDLYEIVKVVVLKAGESFTYDGDQQAVATKDRQVYVMPTRAMSRVVRLAASSPVLVLEVMAGRDNSHDPDVSMTLALPVSRWSSGYRVYLPPNNQPLTVSLLAASAQASFVSSVQTSSETYSSASSSTTATMSYEVPGGTTLAITCRQDCLFTGFLVFSKSNGRRASVLALLGLILDEETMTAAAATTEAATSTEGTETTTEAATSAEAAETTTTEGATTSTEAATTTEKECCACPVCCACPERDNKYTDPKSTNRPVINDSTPRPPEPEVQELVLDRTSLSSHIRSKTSAPNKRASSVFLGSTLGISVLVTVLALIVLPDLLSLFRVIDTRPAPRPRRVKEAWGTG